MYKKYGNSIMRMFFTLAIASLSVGSYADIKSFVDRPKVTTNETFTLTIELDEYTNDEPDLSVIPEEVEVVGSSSYHRSSIINGAATTQLGWKIQLRISEVGVFTLPEIAVGDEQTAPIQITVEEPSSQFLSDDNIEAIMLRAEVSEPRVYVQQQIIFTLRLYRAVQTQYASLTEPKLENALVEKLGEDRQYESTINNTRYLVLEREYAIFPQESGTLVIPRVIFSADVIERGSGGVGRMLGQTRPVTVATEEKTVEVKPFPENHNGIWLPAKKVTLDARWSHVGEKKVGEPATWTITLTGEGLHHNQLPDLQLPSVDAAKLYPDTAEKTHQVAADGITAVRTERIAVVPTKEGKLTIPPISVRWFNTNTQQYEIAQLEAETIQVAANPVDAVITPQNMAPQIAHISRDTSTNTASESFNIWFWLTWVALSLWLTTLLFYWLKTRASEKEKQSATSVLPNSPVKEQLINALANQNKTAVYRYLTQWFNEVAGVKKYREHLEFISNEKIKNSLLRLENAIFSSEKVDWNDYKILRSHLITIENSLKKSRAVQTLNNDLPALYPSG